MHVFSSKFYSFLVELFYSFCSIICVFLYSILASLSGYYSSFHCICMLGSFLFTFSVKLVLSVCLPKLFYYCCCSL